MNISETLRTYRNHQGVADKFCKTLSYTGTFLSNCGMLLSLPWLRKFGTARQAFWCLSAVRDLPQLKDLFSSAPDNPKRGDFKTAYLLSFRILFVVRTYLKLFNWIRPNAAIASLQSGLSRLPPAYILTFSGYSLYHTYLKSQHEKLTFQDGLSVTDDIAEVICTSLEGSYIPGFGTDNCTGIFSCSICISSFTGIISGAASLLNRSIDVYKFHSKPSELDGRVASVEMNA